MFEFLESRIGGGTVGRKKDVAAGVDEKVYAGEGRGGAGDGDAFALLVDGA